MALQKLYYACESSSEEATCLVDVLFFFFASRNTFLKLNQNNNRLWNFYMGTVSVRN